MFIIVLVIIIIYIIIFAKCERSEHWRRLWD